MTKCLSTSQLAVDIEVPTSFRDLLCGRPSTRLAIALHLSRSVTDPRLRLSSDEFVKRARTVRSGGAVQAAAL